MTALAPAKVRFKLLDGLRLAAAIAVMAYHYLGFQHGRWGVPTDEKFAFLSEYAAYGALGVHLFFIISGFVILMSAWGRTVPQFVASRAARLYPAYWVAVLSVAVLFIGITAGAIKDVTIGEVMVNLTMLQGPSGVRNLDGVYWTLGVELMFYLLIGLLISRNPTRGTVTAFVFLWPMVAIIAARTDFKFLSYFLSPQYAPLFAGGMALYLINAYGHSLVNWLLVGFNAVIAAQQTSAGFFAKEMIPNTKQDMSATVCIVIILVMFVLVALVTVTPLKGWGPGWLTYAGALTYPLYLMHEHWGWWIISWANPMYGKWVALFMAAAFAFGSAALIERLVERPLHPRLRKAILRGFDTRTPEKVNA